MIWEAEPTGKRGRQPDDSSEHPSWSSGFCGPEAVGLDEADAFRHSDAGRDVTAGAVENEHDEALASGACLTGE